MDDKMLPDKKSKKANPLAENRISYKPKEESLADFLQSKRKKRTNEAVKNVRTVGSFEKEDDGKKTKGTSLHEKAVEKKSSNRRSYSVDNIGFKSAESGLKNDVTQAENVEKPEALLSKRKRGADGEIMKAFLSSQEKGLSLLRPRKNVAFFRKVELSEIDFERVVGKRVKIYWSGSRKWFVGRIKSFDNEKKLHKILYNDGDVEELDLAGEQFELEVVPSEAFVLCSRLGPNLLKKDMASNGGEVGKKSNVGGSFEVSVSEPLLKYSRKKKDVVSEAAKKNSLNEHGGPDTEEKEENWPSDVKVDVILENADKKLRGGDIDNVENYVVVNYGNGNGKTEPLSKVVVETDEKLAKAEATRQEPNHENEETSSGCGIINGSASRKSYDSVGNTDPIEEHAYMINKFMSKAMDLEEYEKHGNRMHIWTSNCENGHSGTKYTPKHSSKQTNAVHHEKHENLIEKKLKSKTGEAAGRIVRNKESGDMNILEGILRTKADGAVLDTKTPDSQPSNSQTEKNEVDTRSATLKHYVRYGHKKARSRCIYLS